MILTNNITACTSSSTGNKGPPHKNLAKTTILARVNN